MPLRRGSDLRNGFSAFEDRETGIGPGACSWKAGLGKRCARHCIGDVYVLQSSRGLRGNPVVYNGKLAIYAVTMSTSISTKWPRGFQTILA